MDWWVDAGVVGASAAVTSDVISHLRRHAASSDDLDMAAPTVARALDHLNAGGRWWVRLEWDELLPRLTVRRLHDRAARPPVPSTVTPAHGDGRPGHDGVAPAHERAHELAAAATGEGFEMVVATARVAEFDVDPPTLDAPRRLPDRADELWAWVTVELARHHRDGRTSDEAAAAVGAAVAERGRLDAPVRSAAAHDVAETFVGLQRRVGADFFVVEASEKRAVLGNRRCPFGPAAKEAPHLCRMTSAMAGRLAAQAGGSARVTLDERLALGDHQCRLVIDLTDEPHPAAQLYRRDPPGWPAGDAAGVPATVGFRVSLSLRLPRDRMSVPVIRHLCGAALAEVGVVRDQVEDVELALTEACGNVLDHAGPGDAYEVELSIRPEACDIRVIDIGRGFDAGSLGSAMAAPTAEQGRGISLMRALMDQVRFRSEPEAGTIVHLVKHLDYDESVPARRLLGLAGTDGATPD